MTPPKASDRPSFPTEKGSNPEQQPQSPQRPSSIAERVSLAIASLLLAGVIGLVSYLWMSDRHRQPPSLQVTQSSVRESTGQYYVPFEVHNSGGETAESVQVVAELQIDGVTVESGEQTLDFLSSEERITGTFIFTRDPQAGEVVIRVASYQNP